MDIQQSARPDKRPPDIFPFCSREEKYNEGEPHAQEIDAIQKQFSPPDSFCIIDHGSFISRIKNASSIEYDGAANSSH
jgi:hypothetical protein